MVIHTSYALRAPTHDLMRFDAHWLAACGEGPSSDTAQRAAAYQYTSVVEVVRTRAMCVIGAQHAYCRYILEL